MSRGPPGLYRTCLFSSATPIFPLDFSSLELKQSVFVTPECVRWWPVTVKVTPPSTFLPPRFLPTAGCASAPRPRRKSCSSWRTNFGRRSWSWRTSVLRPWALLTTWTRSGRPWTACRWGHTLPLLPVWLTLAFDFSDVPFQLNSDKIANFTWIFRNAN